MKCPNCDEVALGEDVLDTDLLSLHCPECGGRWIPSSSYWKWHQEHGENLPEKPPEAGLSLTITESGRAKLCPECGHILIRHKVGHELDFSLDHCGGCGGVWYDQNEWEMLKSRNLHDDVHFIFSQSWQADVFRKERARARERLLVEKFGEADYAEIRRIKAWLDSHPHKNELYAFLLHSEP